MALIMALELWGKDNEKCISKEIGEGVFPQASFVFNAGFSPFHQRREPLPFPHYKFPLEISPIKFKVNCFRAFTQ